MSIITFVLIPLAGIFPMGHRAVQRGRTISVASALAEQAINQVRAQYPTLPPGGAPAITTQVQTIGAVDYTVSLQLWPVAYRTQPDGSTQCYLVDAVVDVSYRGTLPFEYTTRLSADSQDMQSP